MWTFVMGDIYGAYAALLLLLLKSLGLGLITQLSFKLRNMIFLYYIISISSLTKAAKNKRLAILQSRKC